MWTCHNCGAKNNDGTFCGKCGAKRRIKKEKVSKISMILVWVRPFIQKIREYIRANHELCVFFAYYSLFIFAFNSFNDSWWWITSNIKARQVVLDGFFQQWMRTYLILYITVPIITEIVVSRWDKVKPGFLKEFAVRFLALITGIVLFSLVFGGIILGILNNYNFRHFTDKNTEDFFALTVYLALAQPFSVLLSFSLKKLCLKILTRGK